MAPTQLELGHFNYKSMYNLPPGQCLLGVSYEKIQEIIQDKHENSSQFLALLTNALLQYAALDAETPVGSSSLWLTSSPGAL